MKEITVSVRFVSPASSSSMRSAAAFRREGRSSYMTTSLSHGVPKVANDTVLTDGASCLKTGTTSGTVIMPSGGKPFQERMKSFAAAGTQSCPNFWK